MKKRSKAKKEVRQEAEDWCLVCKDGGELIICDRKGCMKVYHANCVGKDEASLETGEHWSCDRHTCFVCKQSAKMFCFCCPNAVCGRCNSAAEFAQVRGNGGLCDDCVKLILLIEEKADCNSDGEKLDFDDRDTQECLFKEYWEIIKEREGLTLEHVYSADNRLQKCGGHSSDSKPIAISDSEETDESVSMSDEDDKVKRSRGKRTYESSAESDEGDSDRAKKRPRGKVKRSHSRSKKFEGWGSTPLMDFLNSIGEDTSKELSLLDVDNIISRYIQENDLCDPKKKKTVRCDEKLKAIFKKKTVNRNKIYHLLHPHFMEMVVSSSEDEKVNGSRPTARVRGTKAARPAKKERASDSKIKLKEKEAVPKAQEVPMIQESRFAAINSNNLKLVYLKRSFMEELFKEPETAEGKIVGSFVKIKRDPQDLLLKSSHQLLQVKALRRSEIMISDTDLLSLEGLKQGSSANNNAEILLEVLSLSKPISIKMLSDADLSEEECEEFRQRVENGIFEKPTVEELQQKATSLHEFITKLSMEKEITLLQNLIDQANEKGWRREKDTYLERKALLRNPSEQERRLKQVPKIMPESTKLKSPASSRSSLEDDSESDEEESAESPQSCSKGLQMVRASPL